MSCPHISGLAALIKAVHPSWSPSAVKSAIMTTATVLNKNGKIMAADPEGRPANAFDFGSGFPDPAKFLNPGLIYDTRPADYKAFLCSIGYDDKSLQQMTGDKSVCSRLRSTPSNLNYPSITLSELKDSYRVTRTVTNVGKPRSIYRSVVSPPAGICVSVSPKYLSFRRYGQKANFTVSFRAVRPSRDYVFGSLAWKAVGDVQVVTSPLVVRVATSDTGLI